MLCIFASRVREVQQAVAAHLMEVEPAVQQAVLKCIKVLKFKYLNPHMDRLMRLADDKTLRSELTAFPVAKGADNGVNEEHRPGLVRPALIPGLLCCANVVTVMQYCLRTHAVAKAAENGVDEEHRPGLVRAALRCALCCCVAHHDNCNGTLPVYCHLIR